MYEIKFKAEANVKKKKKNHKKTTTPKQTNKKLQKLQFFNNVRSEQKNPIYSALFVKFIFGQPYPSWPILSLPRGTKTNESSGHFKTLLWQQE